MTGERPASTSLAATRRRLLEALLHEAQELTADTLEVAE